MLVQILKEDGFRGSQVVYESDRCSRSIDMIILCSPSLWKSYIRTNKKQLGRLLSVTSQGGPGLKEVKVRRFREGDVEDVLGIFAADGLIHNEEERERTRKGLEKNAREPEWYDDYLVAEVDGKVVRRVILEAAYPPYSELMNLYVLPEYQGIGVVHVSFRAASRQLQLTRALSCQL